MLWPRLLRTRLEQREADVEAASRVVDRAREENHRARRIEEESRNLRDTNGFTQAVIDIFGVAR